MFSSLCFSVLLSNMNICELLVSVPVDTHFHLLADNSTKLDTTNTVFSLLPSPAQGYGSAWFGTAKIHGDPGLGVVKFSSASFLLDEQEGTCSFGWVPSFSLLKREFRSPLVIIPLAEELFYSKDPF